MKFIGIIFLAFFVFTLITPPAVADDSKKEDIQAPPSDKDDHSGTSADKRPVDTSPDKKQVLIQALKAQIEVVAKKIKENKEIPEPERKVAEEELKKTTEEIEKKTSALTDELDKLKDDTIALPSLMVKLYAPLQKYTQELSNEILPTEALIHFLGVYYKDRSDMKTLSALLKNWNMTLNELVEWAEKVKEGKNEDDELSRAAKFELYKERLGTFAKQMQVSTKTAISIIKKMAASEKEIDEQKKIILDEKSTDEAKAAAKVQYQKTLGNMGALVAKYADSISSRKRDELAKQKPEISQRDAIINGLTRTANVDWSKSKKDPKTNPFHKGFNDAFYGDNNIVKENRKGFWGAVESKNRAALLKNWSNNLPSFVQAMKYQAGSATEAEKALGIKALQKLLPVLREDSPDSKTKSNGFYVRDQNQKVRFIELKGTTTEELTANFLKDHDAEDFSKLEIISKAEAEGKAAPETEDKKPEPPSAPAGENPTTPPTDSKDVKKPLPKGPNPKVEKPVAPPTTEKPKTEKEVAPLPAKKEPVTPPAVIPPLKTGDNVDTKKPDTAASPAFLALDKTFTEHKKAVEGGCIQCHKDNGIKITDGDFGNLVKPDKIRALFEDPTKASLITTMLKRNEDGGFNYFSKEEATAIKEYLSKLTGVKPAEPKPKTSAVDLKSEEFLKAAGIAQDKVGATSSANGSHHIVRIKDTPDFFAAFKGDEKAKKYTLVNPKDPLISTTPVTVEVKDDKEKIYDYYTGTLNGTPSITPRFEKPEELLQYLNQNLKDNSKDGGLKSMQDHWQAVVPPKTVKQLKDSIISSFPTLKLKSETMRLILVKIGDKGDPVFEVKESSDDKSPSHLIQIEANGKITQVAK